MKDNWQLIFLLQRQKQWQLMKCKRLVSIVANFYDSDIALGGGSCVFNSIETNVPYLRNLPSLNLDSMNMLSNNV